jgi:hypothetical protein
LCRGISDFKKGYQPKSNIVNDDKNDWFADSHSILARCKNYFSRLLNVHVVNNVRQTEIHTAEPLMPEPSVSEYELAIEKLKVTDHQVLIKYHHNCLRQLAVRLINLLFLFGIRKNYLRIGRSRSWYLCKRRAIK